MKSLSRFLWALCLGWASPAAADPHPACTHPFATLPDASPETLRGIAESCSDRAVLMLFYNRAYHADVLHELQWLSGALGYGRSSNDAVRYEQARIFVGLAEAFAERAHRAGEPGAIDALNLAYDESIELVSYVIKGYDQFIGRTGDPVPAGN